MATRNWTRNVNIFEKDFVILPVCKDDHWFLVIMKMEKTPTISIMVLDSANEEQRVNTERTIKRYL